MPRAFSVALKAALYVTLVLLCSFLLLSMYEGFSDSSLPRKLSSHPIDGLLLVLGLAAAILVFIRFRHGIFGLFGTTVLVTLLHIFFAPRLFGDVEYWGLGLSIAGGVMFGLPLGIILAIASLVSDRKVASQSERNLPPPDKS